MMPINFTNCNRVVALKTKKYRKKGLTISRYYIPEEIIKQ
jgi:hypothetical protein